MTASTGPSNSPSIIVMTEQALTAADAGRILGLHADEAPTYRLLVPADTHRSLLADVLDHLSLLELREALEAVRGHEDDDRLHAGATLETSLTHLRAAGATVQGSITQGDPIAALRKELVEAPDSEIIIVTRPHAVEDTFHTDWASRARETLGVPVLHVYAGSSWLG